MMESINQSAVIHHKGPMTRQDWRLEFTKEILAQNINTLLFVTSVSTLMFYLFIYMMIREHRAGTMFHVYLHADISTITMSLAPHVTENLSLIKANVHDRLFLFCLH